MTTPRVGAVLLDMDGVIRHWRDDAHTAAERAAGLPAGSLGKVMYDVPEFEATQVGAVSDAEWVLAVKRRLAEEHGDEPAHRAVTKWSAYRGHIDAEMVALVSRLREQLPVGLLSNATDRLRQDLEHHGLHEAFDLVLCSAELRMAKPDPAIFTHAAQAIGEPPDRCFFADDRPANVDGARATGMLAAVFTSREELEAELRTLGLAV